MPQVFPLQKAKQYVFEIKEGKVLQGLFEERAEVQ
jgi:hypothetical protein